ncbi:MAG: acetyl-CoA decarbonylase/synthase complex subunit alpha/beta, partial [Desulfovibrionaceae bacterium]
MSRVICTSAIDGAVSWLATAEGLLRKAIEDKGGDAPVEFPETAYYLPVTYALTGQAVNTLDDLRETLRTAKELLPPKPDPDCWLPYLGPALDAGLAALLACEALEACKYVVGPDPTEGLWRGAASDVIMRERGVEFVDGAAPGFAAITGAAPDSATAVKIARELQEKNLYVFMGGGSGKTSFAEQLESEGVQLGWETRLVPFGPEISSLIYALGFANRAAMAFGGIKPGEATRNLLYNKDRVFAFVLALGEVTPEKFAVAAGAINYGFPVIADTDIPEVLPSGICTYEHVVANVPHDRMVEKALEVRGCKITIHEVPVPVAYGPAFEGEVIRKNEVRAEFGGRKTTAFEFVTTAPLDEIEDHSIEIIGPDVDEVENGAALPLAIWVEVAGRKMQPDFEPILERQIHHFINGAEGVWHMGQRDIVWTRISRAAYDKGFCLRHYGEILHAKLLSQYPAIVDKVQVTLITDQEEVERRLEVARKVYDDRDRRLESMTDESVETFYSCLLCQSFAPNHVCVITPERAGLCGAYNWLDGKAAHEIDETGPNQPVAKGGCLDPSKGVWEGVNDYVLENSHRAIDRVCAYSIMDSPMTSCGCFEAICAYVPECNGVMVVHREHPDETPVGMKFSTLAGNVGGGVQIPGFIGLSKIYVTSRKFLFSEGGQKRLVWMPKDLKEQLADDLKKRCADLGEADLLDKIADETVAVEPSAIR